MLTIFLYWLVMSFVFLSYGNMFISLWNKGSKANQTYSFSDTFWLGLCTVGGILLSVSIFIPLHIGVLAFFILSSIVYWIWNRAKALLLWATATSYIRGLSVWTKSILVLAILAICIHALLSNFLYDFGLYQLQYMMWNESYSAVPGLGNLHGRLGFNSSFILLSGLFSYHPIYYTPSYPLNSLCFLVFSFWLIVKADKMQSIVQKLVFAFVIFACAFLFTSMISSSSTDMLVGLLVMYILFTGMLEEKAMLSRSLVFSIIPVFCITLKLSSAPILLITLLLFVYLVRDKEYKNTLLLTLIGSMIIIPWLVRFVILTGYLVYPYPSIDLFHFDWKMPLDMVILEKNAAYSWARIPDQDFDKILAMPMSKWLPVWFRGLKKIELFLYVLAAISPILVLIGRKAFKKNLIVLAIWFIAFCGFLFGFFTAPSPRFSYGFILAVGIIPFLFFNLGYLEKKTPPLFVKFIFLSIFLFLGITGVQQLKTYPDNDSSFYTLLYKPQLNDYGKETVNPAFITKKSVNTFIYVPQVGDRCFDHCLPCTPYFDANIEMRGLDYQYGFRIKRERMQQTTN